MFGRKKRLQEHAEDLISECHALATSCNTTSNFSLFMDDFEKLLSCTEELCNISKKIKLQGIVGNPWEDYARIRENAQLTIQNALRRHFDKLTEDNNTKFSSYKNSMNRLSSFRESIEENQSWFDQSTRRVATLLLQQLENSIESLPEQLNVSRNPDLLVAATELSLEKGEFLIPEVCSQLKTSYMETLEIRDALLELGILKEGESSICYSLAVGDSALAKMIIESATTQSVSSPKTHITAIDHMNGLDFEHWCARLLVANGFTDVEVTRGSGDQGVDILATKDEVRYAIQCKCYSSDLGNTPIQEVYAGKAFYHCQIGAVMTNCYFTSGAKELAESNGVLLWDRDKLIAWMESLPPDAF